jgi:Hinge domain of cleavage stimulation factor subunit 2
VVPVAMGESDQAWVLVLVISPTTMSNPSLPEEQLLELLLQLKVRLRLVFTVLNRLKNCTRKLHQTRALLNSQPQIAYALITLMANMNVVNVDVLHVCGCRTAYR